MEDNNKKKNGAIKYLLDMSDNILSSIAMIFLVTMIVIVSTTVFTRYVFNFTLRWSDEVALLMMIWFGFIGMALGVKENIHLSIEFFMSLVPDRFQNFIYKVEDIAVGAFGGLMVKYGWDLYNATKTTVLPATQWTRGLLFIMLPVSGLFIIIYSIGKLLGIIGQESRTVEVDLCKEED